MRLVVTHRQIAQPRLHSRRPAAAACSSNDRTAEPWASPARRSTRPPRTGAGRRASSRRCDGTAPTAPGTGATIQERQEYRQKLAEYNRCKAKERIRNRIENRCERITNKINTIIARFEENRNRHLKVYTNMKNRIQEFIDRAKSKGIDTSKLETDFETLKNKIAKFSTDLAAHIDDLKQTKNFACGESQGQFKKELTDSRASRKLLLQDAADIRKFVRTTIMVDIKEIKKKFPGAASNSLNPKPAETEDTENDKTNE